MINTLINYNLSILDNKGTTDSLVCESLETRFCVCSECGSVYRIDLTCDERTCLYCQKKRAKRLFMKYLQAVQSWRQDDGNLIQFLTITNVNVKSMTRTYVDERDKLLSDFLKQMKKFGYVFDYGFINKECTWSESNGFHYHWHILFYGKPIDLKILNLSKMWRNVSQDSYIVKLYSKFNNGEHSLRYMLKYVCKQQEVSEAMQVYYRETKGKRYFQTFGLKYKEEGKSKIQFVCSGCFGKFRKSLSGQVLFEHVKNEENSKRLNFARIRAWMVLESERKMRKREVSLKLFEIELDEEKFSWEQKVLLIVRKYDSEPFNVDLILSELSVEELERAKRCGLVYESRNGRIDLL